MKASILLSVLATLSGTSASEMRRKGLSLMQCSLPSMLLHSAFQHCWRLFSPTFWAWGCAFSLPIFQPRHSWSTNLMKSEGDKMDWRSRGAAQTIKGSKGACSFSGNLLDGCTINNIKQSGCRSLSFTRVGNGKRSMRLVVWMASADGVGSREWWARIERLLLCSLELQKNEFTKKMP